MKIQIITMILLVSFIATEPIFAQADLTVTQDGGSFLVEGTIESATNSTEMIYLRAENLDNISYSTGWDREISLVNGTNTISEAFCCLPSNDNFEATVQVGGEKPLMAYESVEAFDPVIPTPIKIPTSNSTTTTNSTNSTAPTVEEEVIIPTHSTAGTVNLCVDGEMREVYGDDVRQLLTQGATTTCPEEEEEITETIEAEPSRVATSYSEYSTAELAQMLTDILQELMSR